VSCKACKRNFPERNLPNYPTSCEICTSSFCNIYFRNCLRRDVNNGPLFRVDQIRFPNVIVQNVFRGNFVEVGILVEYMKEN
jgi:hypothetical protein